MEDVVGMMSVNEWVLVSLQLSLRFGIINIYNLETNPFLTLGLNKLYMFLVIQQSGHKAYATPFVLHRIKHLQYLPLFVHFVIQILWTHGQKVIENLLNIISRYGS